MTAIEFNNVSKQYRLGVVSSGMLCHDLNRFWQTKVLHREDPYLRIGETNDRTTKGTSDYVWALRDIDFKVEKGDVVGIIGRNGAGKSTLLKLLSRVTLPTTGAIRARGRIASLLEVGTGFHPEMTGRENIYMNGAILGMTRAEIARKMDEIVDFSGCERYLDTPVKRYSSGMSVRLGFAIAAHLEPEILIVDEVLAVGDAEFQKKAIGKMQDVARGQGRTVLFVSHNMGAVLQLCRRGIVLRNGQLDFDGTADDAVRHYAATNIAELKCGGAVTDADRRKGSGEILFTEVRLLNDDPSALATDEPIELFLKFRHVFGSVGLVKIMVNVFDETDARIMGYLTEGFAIPSAPEFAVRLTLLNHSLTKRRYKVGFSIGYRDYGANVRDFDIVRADLVSFEVRYISKSSKVEYSAFNPRSCAAVIHQGVNLRMSVEQGRGVSDEKSNFERSRRNNDNGWMDAETERQSHEETSL